MEELAPGGVIDVTRSDVINLLVGGPEGFVGKNYYATALNGVATFNQLGSLPTPGNYTYSAASANSLPAVAHETVAAVTAGVAAQAVTVNVPISAAGTVNAVNVVTTGALNQDFTWANAGSCAAGSAVAVGETCTATVNLTPLEAGLRTGAVTLQNANGKVLGTAYLAAVAEGPVVAFDQGATSGLSGNWNNANVVTVDEAGNLYLGEASANIIVKVPATSSGYGAPAQIGPSNIGVGGIAVDGAGNVFCTDVIHTSLVELPWNGTGYGSAVNIPSGLNSGFAQPEGVAVDGAGNLYVADAGTEEVIEMPWTGTGYGTGVLLPPYRWNNPNGVAVDSLRNVYVADWGSNVVVQIPYGASGYASPQPLSINSTQAWSVAVDAADNLYFTDAGGGIVYRILAQPGGGFGSQTQVGSQFNVPGGIAAAANGNLFVTDLSPGVWEIDLADGPSLSFPTQTQVGLIDTTDGPQSATVTNTGNQPLIFPAPSTGTNPSYPDNFPVNFGASGLCGTSSMAVGATCYLSSNFSPSQVGANQGQIILTDSAISSPQVVSASGTAIPPAPVAQVTPGALGFSSRFAGFVTPPQTVTLTNIGAAVLNISNVGLSGAGFSIVANGCGSTLGAGASCMVGVSFAAPSTGPFSGNLTFTDNSQLGTTQTVTLSGSGTVQPGATQLAFAPAPAAIMGVNSNVGILTVLEETRLGVQNYAAADNVTLKVAGPSGYSQTYTQTAVSGAASFNLSAATLTLPGNYTFTALVTGLNRVSAQILVIQTGYNWSPPINEGQSTNSRPISVIFSAGGTLNSIVALTQGERGLAFVPASGGTCVLGNAYLAGQSCTTMATFIPHQSGISYGAIVLQDANGNTLGSAYLSGSGMGPQVSFGTGVESQIGSGWGEPAGVILDPAGNVYVSDASNQSVMELPLTLSGYGAPESLGTGMSSPSGLVLDGAGNLFVADTGNSRVLELPWNGTAYGPQISIGSGWSSPAGLAVDGAGDLFVADTSNTQIVELPATGTGFGAPVNLGSGFNNPSGVAVDWEGNVFVADSNNMRVVEIPFNGKQYEPEVIVGGGYSAPADVAMDGPGNLYVSDMVGGAVYMLPRKPGSGAHFGTQVTLIGGLSYPEGITADSYGNVYVADFWGSSVEELDVADAPSLSFPTTTLVGTTDKVDGPQTVKVSNFGNSILTFTSPSTGANPSYAASFPEKTANTILCSSAKSVQVTSSCDISVTFKPSAAGAATGSVVLTDNPGPFGSIQSISLTGAGANQLTPVLTWATPPAMTYGTALGSTQPWNRRIPRITTLQASFEILLFYLR